MLSAFVDGFSVHQILVTNASWDTAELVRFWGQKVRGQNHSVTKCVKTVIFGISNFRHTELTVIIIVSDIFLHIFLLPDLAMN